MGTLQPLPEHHHPPAPGGPESQTISLHGCADWKGHEGIVGNRGMFHPDITISLPVHNCDNGGKQNNICTPCTSQLTMFHNYRIQQSLHNTEKQQQSYQKSGLLNQVIEELLPQL